MSNEFIVFVLGALVLCMVVHAYNMGWQAGHDIHHSDDVPRPEKPDEPQPPRTLYV